jgi:hypothetical protein
MGGGGTMAGLNRLDPMLRNTAIPARSDDIQRLNEQLLLIAIDPELAPVVLRLLGASESLASRLFSVSSKGIATAIRCGVPLVRFTAQLEELVSADPRRWRIVASTEVPEELKRLTLFCLHLAQDLALRNIGLAKMLFGMTRLVVERLRDMAVLHLETLSVSGKPLIRLCEGTDLQWWAGILIGERCVGPKAFRIARYTAQQRLQTL